MANIKSLAAIGKKWATVTPQRAGEYEEGIRNPRTPWKAATLAAVDRQKAGVQKAIANDSYKKGVAAVSDTKWSENAIAKGAQRYGQGVALAQSAYEKGYAPYQQIIAALQLPARGAKGDPSNIQRVAVVAKALNDAKMTRGK